MASYKFHMRRYRVWPELVFMKIRSGIILIGLLLVTAAYGESLTVGFLAGAGGLGDESYNDATLSGLAEGKRQYGYRLVHEQSDETETGIQKSLEHLISQHASIIVSNRIAHPGIVYQFAKDNPSRHFILNDMSLEKGYPNVAVIGYSHHEGAFLAGALAGWMTKTGKVGFIGGNQMPIISSFRIGFMEGVHYANPAVEFFEDVVAKGNDPKGFDDPKTAYTLSMALYKKNVDIVFAVAGLSGNGVIHAAKITHKFAIGVDTDQDHMAKGNVLTSMIKRLDKANLNEVSAILDGHFQPGIRYYGLKEEGVGLSPMTYTRHLIPDTVIKQLDEAKRKIISGEIRVTDYKYLEQ